MARRRYSRRPSKSSDPVAMYLGDQQAAVLDILWARGSATVRQVLSELDGELAYTTVMTMLVRLYERGLLIREQDGRGFRYRPTKTRDEYVSELAGSLLERLVADFGDAALIQILQTADEVRPDRAAQLRKRLADA